MQLNVISLEFSASKFARHVGRPRFVREIDWIEHLWPSSVRAEGDYPAVERVRSLVIALLRFADLRVMDSIW